MKNFCLAVVGIMLVAFLGTSEAEAGWLFGRRASCSGGSCQVQSRTTVTAQTTTTVKASSTSETATAQGVANIMARLGRVGHFGGHRWYEGCGCASSPQQAYAICCYANSGLTTYDVGYARGANGMWYCCRRYRP